MIQSWFIFGIFKSKVTSQNIKETIQLFIFDL